MQLRINTSDVMRGDVVAPLRGKPGEYFPSAGRIEVTTKHELTTGKRRNQASTRLTLEFRGRIRPASRKMRVGNGERLTTE
jgi:hypothetical protein